MSGLFWSQWIYCSEVSRLNNKEGDLSTNPQENLKSSEDWVLHVVGSSNRTMIPNTHQKWERNGMVLEWPSQSPDLSPSTLAAVAQEEEWVVQESEGPWSESLATRAACQTILEQDT